MFFCSFYHVFQGNSADRIKNIYFCTVYFFTALNNFIVCCQKQMGDVIFKRVTNFHFGLNLRWLSQLGNLNKLAIFQLSLQIF